MGEYSVHPVMELTSYHQTGICGGSRHVRIFCRPCEGAYLILIKQGSVVEVGVGEYSVDPVRELTSYSSNRDL